MTKLFSAFNTVSKEEWKKKIIFDLNGADYYEKLASNSEGIEIAPIYHSDDKKATLHTSFPENWESYQLISSSNAEEGNKRALEALQNDISGLCFSNPNNLNVLLKGIEIEHIRIDFTNYSKSFPLEWHEFIKKKKVKDFILLNGDTIFDINLNELIKSKKKNTLGSIALIKNNTNKNNKKLKLTDC